MKHASKPMYESLESRTLFAAAPQITSVNITAANVITLVSSVDLAPATVNANSVRVYTVGPDGVLGTADDTNVGATVVYNVNTRAIRITSNLPANSYYRVHLDADVIRSTSNVALDGEFISSAGRSGDGQPGGDFDLVRQTIARFVTKAGNIDVRLFGDRTPITVNNFIQYANGTGGSTYDNSFFHRSVPGFVVQGGGFRANATFDSIPTLGMIQNEPGISNTRGTIAMAKLGGNPNSATSQFFFNLGNNASNLDNQNGGFTVFGEIVDSAGLAVMDRLAQYERVNAGSPFEDLPVEDLQTVIDRGSLDPSDLITVTTVDILTENVALTEWQVGAVADFDGDGDADIMWRNYRTGENQLWVMQGNTRQSIVNFQPLANTAWKLVGAADFNGDDIVDLVWRNISTGQNTISFLNNTRQFQSFKATHSIANFSWALEGVGDLNGDGDADLVWRSYDNGRNCVWFMDGATAPQAQMKAIPPVANTSFKLAAIGDVSGDGKADLIFRNTATGVMSLWTMNGNAVVSFKGMQSRPNQDWILAGAGRFDSAGADLLWTNPTSGTNEVWTLTSTGAYGTTLNLAGIPT